MIFLRIVISLYLARGAWQVFSGSCPSGPHGPTIQTRVDINGGETATVIETANNAMVSVIAV
jgi:hypothetical protein